MISRNSLKTLVGSISFPILPKLPGLSLPGETVNHAVWWRWYGWIRFRSNPESSSVKIRAIAEIDQEAQQAKQRFKDTNVYADWREMLNEART